MAPTLFCCKLLTKVALANPLELEAASPLKNFEKRVNGTCPGSPQLAKLADVWLAAAIPAAVWAARHAAEFAPQMARLLFAFTYSVKNPFSKMLTSLIFKARQVLGA